MIESSGFRRFLDGGVSSYHVARQIGARLREDGFQRLRWGSQWTLEGQGRYFVEHAGAVVAWRNGTVATEEGGAVIAAAHTDSPALQLKIDSARVVERFLQVPIEVYGGPIIATWLDRELTVAGRVAIEHDGVVETRLISSPRASGWIPNLAIHLNREANESLSYNKQDHLKVLFPIEPDDETEGVRPRERLLSLVLAGSDIPSTEVIDAELFVVPSQPARMIGGDLVVSARIDNLAGCYSVVEALCAVDHATKHLCMGVCFNHEEIGSSTDAGAMSPLVERVLARIVTAQGDAPPPDRMERTLSRTILISNDGAHACHPNYHEKHDPGYAPRVGGGPVVKKSAVWRYTGDLRVSGWFAAVCRREGIPLQYMQNRSDLRAGSTIGPLTSTRLGVRGVDVGVPMLSMHSTRESASIGDVDALTRAMYAAYSGSNGEILDPDSPREG